MNESIDQYPHLTTEKVRYSDTDLLGHVNNVLFAVFFEAGRIAVLFGERALNLPGTHFVIVRTCVDFISELKWPGEVTIGTRVEKLGTSSIASRQALFQNGVCAAVSTSVMVHVDLASRKSTPLSAEARDFLTSLMAQEGR
jgi:acyl-CoA thioester hydrolase